MRTNIKYLILSSVLLLLVSLKVFGAPPGSFYTPGETTDPACAPGSVNCDVQISTNTDDQSLTLSGSTLSIEDGNSVILSTISTAWSNITGIPADISDGDDDTQLTEVQVDGFVANNGYLTGYIDTDDQTLSLSGADLSIVDGNTVDLSSLTGGDTLYSTNGTVGAGRTVGITDTLDFDSGTFKVDGTNNKVSFGSGIDRASTITVNMSGANDGIDIRQTSTGSSERPLQIINDSDSGVSLYIKHNSATNSQGGIRIDGPRPEIEFVENDQVSPVGKWEIQANGNDFSINSRNAADSGYEKYLFFNGSLVNGGQMVLNARTSSATRDLFIINNKQSSAGARPGFAWQNEVGGVTTARLSSKGGAAFADSEFYIQVADSSKVLQERFMIDVDGNIGIGTTTPTSNLHVVNTGASAKLELERTDGVKARILAGGTVFQFAVDEANAVVNSDITFRTDGQERLKIDDTGNIGIDTVAPGTKLDVNGTIRVADGGEACTVAIKGAIKYNFSTNKHQGCDGSTWNNLY